MSGMERKAVREQDNKQKVQFTVVREFAGGQKMQDVFERLIEHRVRERLEEWLGRKAG